MTPFQTAFRAALLDPTHPAPGGLTDGAGAPTQRRFDVYRNNVTVALVEALRAAFPTVEKLIGAPNFDQLAPLFVRAHPPNSPVMMHYGAAFPAFLDTFAPLAHLGYLSDVARLDLAMRQSYHAADAAPADMSGLAVLAPEALLQTTFALAPATIIVPSVWPLYGIWRFNTEPDAPKPQAIAQPVLITRPAFDPQVHPLTPAQAMWLERIADGATLSDAQDRAAEIDPEFDLSALLGVLISNSALAGFTPPKDPTP